MRSLIHKSGSCLGVLAILLAFAAVSQAQEARKLNPGKAAKIVVRVTEKGAPWSAGAVTIPELKQGANLPADGTASFNVPPGTYTVQVRGQGVKADPKTVVVGPGQTVNVDIAVLSGVAKTLAEISVVSNREVLRKTSSDVRQNVRASDVTEKPVDNLIQAISLKAGVVNNATGLHVRGGRSGEVKTTIDGIIVSDPLFGGLISTTNLGFDNADLLLGGLDAEYGNALSGVLAVQTREGRDKFEGQVQYHTDRYGDDRKTYDNYTRLSLGLGGPTPLKKLTYFVSYDGIFSDTYLKTLATQRRSRLLDFISFGPRQDDEGNFQGKLAYRFGHDDAMKMTAEYISNRSVAGQYNLMWSRQGYVLVVPETTFVNPNLTGVGKRDASNIKRINKRYDVWSPVPDPNPYVQYGQAPGLHDPGAYWEYYNAADHFPINHAGFDLYKLTFQQQLSDRTVWSAKASRYQFDNRYGVEQDGRALAPGEYDVQRPDYFSDYLGGLFWATHGDYPVYTESHTVVYTMKSDITSRRGDFTPGRTNGHTLKAGAELVYNQARSLQLFDPNAFVGTSGLPGASRSEITAYNPEGSGFMQDRWEYEGMVINAGLRYDFFSPGPQIPDSDLPSGKRFKTQLSPRLGVAYPVSDRDVFSLHYGRTYQTPDRLYVFENRGSRSSVATQGNPDISPETNISYQAAVQHMFSRDIYGQFSVFFKDIFGLLTVRQKQDPTSGKLVAYYTNGDYASSRGFEVTLTKRMSHHFSGEINYTYGIATGVANDPADATNFLSGGQLYLPIDEQPLDWDIRHNLSAQLSVKNEGSWGVNLIWQYSSGRPYTPHTRYEDKLDPKVINSLRLPSTSDLSVTADKYYRIWGHDMTFFVDARNLLDAQNIANIAQSTYPNPFVGFNENASLNPYDVYFNETGKAGGAFLYDPFRTGHPVWYPLNDPRVFDEGRYVRVGVGVSF
ncbi:MAG TPA: TonB-dependent receptor [Candidatus Saccharimonadales bacterium]|nr:TonB-dependent receptor [Candidatus Saccharimonadales bacterium]